MQKKIRDFVNKHRIDTMAFSGRVPAGISMLRSPASSDLAHNHDSSSSSRVKAAPADVAAGATANDRQVSLTGTAASQATKVHERTFRTPSMPSRARAKRQEVVTSISRYLSAHVKKGHIPDHQLNSFLWEHARAKPHPN